MKKIICIIILMVLNVNFFCFTVSAEKVNNLSDKKAVDFINQNPAKLENLIRESLTEADFYSSENYDGKIEISYPFKIPTFYADTNKLAAPYKGENFSAVIYDNKIIGLVEILGNTKANLCFNKFYFISENYAQDIESGFSLYHNAQYEPLEGEAGSVAYLSIAFMRGEQTSHLAYYDCTFLVDESTRKEFLINNSQIKCLPKTNDLKEYNYIDSKTPIIYDFTITQNEKNNIDDSKEYYIVNNDMYLTYVNGKYSLSERKNTDDLSQKFFIKKSGNDSYYVIPVSNPVSKLTAGNSASLMIKLSYYNDYVYSVRKENNGLYMTSSGSKIVFASDNSAKYGRANQIWKIISD